ncbi:type VI secretion system baseplate subunit TssF [Pseudoduganella violaceinigra]|uniref:type VI secretion system baseplate subunit TssF n=1 Tax=Pseudoduganella violaceinigra TaxID=246602 RepID=UPI0003F66596|nr:type VI secretion system baseplate subunit TssF [Pseudoduganella violaceinigra]
MDKLLHHYEQELGRLRQAAREYAQAHPGTAEALELGPDASTDPEVERLLQSVAVLNASMQQMIEQGRSEFHQALLQTLQPHYLRAVPASCIVQVDTSSANYNGINSVARIPRGSAMTSGASKFTTAYEVCIAPVAIPHAKFRPTINVPATLRLPSDAISSLCVTLEAKSDSMSFERPFLPKLRICITGEAALRAALVDAVLLRCLCVCVEVGGIWKVLEGRLFSKAGFDRCEALLPAMAGEQAFRILSEYLHLPEKFDFFDIDLTQLAASCRPGSRRVNLHIVLPDSVAIMRNVCATNFQLSCTPSINLFCGPALQVRLDGRKDAYPLATGMPGCEIYSVDSVSLTDRTGGAAVLPFHGTNHDADGMCWKLDEQEGCAIALVDREQGPAKLEHGTALVEITCTGSESIQVDDALKTEMGTGGFPVRFLLMPRKTTPCGDASALLESMLLSAISLESLRTLFHLHQFKEVDAFERLDSEAAAAWMDLPIGRVHMLGTAYSLTVDENMLRERSLAVLAEVMEHLLASKTRENRFIQLRLLQNGGKPIYRGEPRVGGQGIV